MTGDHPGASLRVVTVVLAVTCGLAVANLYYAQPLLTLIAGSFDVSEATAAVVVTCTQIGYAAALLFLLPAGDLVENRTLTTRVLLGTAASLLLAGSAPQFATFAVACVLIGVTSVVAQILVPLAAHLAPPEQRGRFVGQVMSGLLLGILLARTAASLVAEWLGWRAIFYVSAGLMLALVPVLLRLLPRWAPGSTPGYGRLLLSTLSLARELPVLRWRAACQASMFAAFSMFWTAIAYELVDDHGLSQTGIALFALVGAGGAAAAPIAGRLADHGRGRAASGAVLALGTASLLLAAAGQGSVPLLALSGVLLDLAVQSHQVLSQQEIYALREDARARINTIYMTSTFVAGAIASAVAGQLHAVYGWAGVCLFGAALPLLGLVLWTARLRPSLQRPAAGAAVRVGGLPSGTGPTR